MTDVARDRAELALALGEPGSGKRRYAAAMRLYHQGHLSAEALEVYRVCAARDGDDPALLLRNRGLGGEAGDPGAPQPDALIGILVDEADGYLATLQGDGIAEVRRGLAPWRGGAVRIAAPGRNPVVERYLPAALTALAATHPALAAAIGAAAPLLDWVQILVFLVFLTFYIPCVSTFAVMLKTLGRREAFFSVALSVGVALGLAGVTRLGAELLRLVV